MHQQPISFPSWKDALANSRLTPATKSSHAREIIAYLRRCRSRHQPASAADMKSYLEAIPKQDAASRAREALRWFYLAARGAAAKAGERSQEQRAAPPRAPVPPLAARDLGGPDWERDLIKAARERGFLWRTEETYRAWAARFARFIAPRSPYAATAEDVAAYLSELAVQQRASPSTQKQALNALVFLLQEGLHRELGEIEFRRARPRERVPTVLSMDECSRFFGALKGPQRLMAELAYGAGLRLMELLRLRVHHLDPARGQLRVLAGKGDKDRVESLRLHAVG